MNLLVYLILLALLGGGVEGQVEQRLRDRLQASFGKIEKLRVVVDRGHRSPLSRTVNKIAVEMEGFKLGSTPGEEGVQWSLGRDVTAGKINEIAIAARRFEMGGLPVKALEIKLEGLRYNFNKLVLRRRLEIVEVRHGEGEITLGEKDLKDFLAPRIKAQVKEFALDFESGKVKISGQSIVRNGLEVPFTLVSEVEAQGGQVNLVKPYLKCSVVPMPSFLSQRMIRKLNPLLDLNKTEGLPCNFRIREIQIRPQELSARADLLFRPDQTDKSVSPMEIPAR
jgi:hypothetical protein